jgi:hypothetical protein
MMMVLSSGTAGKLDRATSFGDWAMRRRWVRIVLGLLAVLLVAAGLFLGLRGPAPEPRYLQLKKGMKWDEAEAVLKAKPHSMYLVHGRLEKEYVDVDGRVRVEIGGEDGDEVVDWEYLPDNPNPDLFQRFAKWLRL